MESCSFEISQSKTYLSMHCNWAYKHQPSATVSSFHRVMSRKKAVSTPKSFLQGKKNQTIFQMIHLKDLYQQAVWMTVPLLYQIWLLCSPSKLSQWTLLCSSTPQVLPDTIIIWPDTFNAHKFFFHTHAVKCFPWRQHDDRMQHNHCIIS